MCSIGWILRRGIPVGVQGRTGTVSLEHPRLFKSIRQYDCTLLASRFAVAGGDSVNENRPQFQFAVTPHRLGDGDRKATARLNPGDVVLGPVFAGQSLIVAHQTLDNRSTAPSRQEMTLMHAHLLLSDFTPWPPNTFHSLTSCRPLLSHPMLRTHRRGTTQIFETVPLVIDAPHQ